MALRFIRDSAFCVAAADFVLSAVIASAGTSAGAWTYERTIVENWLAVELKSEDYDITFACVGPISQSPGSHVRHYVQPDALDHLNFPTPDDGIILTLGPDALPITDRVVSDVSIAVSERVIPLPVMPHSEYHKVYWAILSQDQVALILADVSSDLIVRQRGFLGFGTETRSQIPASNVVELHVDLAADCEEILGRE